MPAKLPIQGKVMMRMAFAAEALRQVVEIGSLTPSSRYLARRMVDCIDPRRPMVVVESGAGEGVVTQAIIERLHHDSQLFVLEPNDRLRELLQRRFNQRNVEVLPNRAENLALFLRSRNLREVERVISSVPLGYLRRHIRPTILQSYYDILSANGIYIQYQYFLSAWFEVKRRFPTAEIAAFEWRNFPPAFVYRCRKS